MIRSAAAAAVIVAAVGAMPLPGGAAPAEPDGYRTEAYRAPVPETLAGGTVVGDDAAYALWKTGRVAFVDVLPRPPKPANLPAGTIWRDPPRRSIPGAVWLPDVGYGRLAESTAAYFREGLAAATGGDPDHPVVFFCLAECWMSWNAARRALVEEGYRRVFWYPDGTDGWILRGWPTEVLTPRPGRE